MCSLSSLSSLPFPLRFASECDKAVYCCTCDDCEGLSLSLSPPPSPSPSSSLLKVPIRRAAANECGTFLSGGRPRPPCRWVGRSVRAFVTVSAAAAADRRRVCAPAAAVMTAAEEEGIEERHGRGGKAGSSLLPHVTVLWRGREKREGGLAPSLASYTAAASLAHPSLPLSSPLLCMTTDGRRSAAAAGDHCHRPSPLPAPPVLAWFCAGKTSQLSAGICGRDISPSSLPSPRVSGRRRRRQRRPRVIPPRLRIIPAAIITSLSTEGTPSYVQCDWIK